MRLASAVIGAFRQSAIVRDRLEEVATDLDTLVAREPRPAYGVTVGTADARRRQRRWTWGDGRLV
ncbi:hypothetical protein [Plantactinospora sp. GCM10030261]|uniref:hypothetical protein n=1 Tax=Plantactinospora sp. GCM10030261 TaxID=3273420 RepID=UPI0036080737